MEAEGEGAGEGEEVRLRGSLAGKLECTIVIRAKQKKPRKKRTRYEQH